MRDFTESNLPKTLFLHIGSEKTGSTAIQNFLKHNIEMLNNLNVSYPISSLEPMICSICVPFASKECVDDCLVFKSTSFYLNKLKEVFSDNERQLKSNVIISSELLHSRLRSEKQISNLKNFLLEYFDIIIPIAYIRDPWEKALSLLSTGLKSGNRILHIKSMKSKYFYHACSNSASIDLWKNVFDNIVVIDYDDVASQSSKAIYKSFLRVIKINDDASSLFTYNSESKPNTSLTLREAYMLSSINSIFHPLCYNKYLRKLHQKLNRFFVVFLFPLLPKSSVNLKTFFGDDDKLDFLKGLKLYEHNIKLAVNTNSK